jgi:hypothetical protein
MPERFADVVIEQVKAVLLTDGSHHPIHPGSLEIGPLVYRSADGSPRPNTSQAGFVVQRTDGTRMSGPLSSLLAVIG